MITYSYPLPAPFTLWTAPHFEPRYNYNVPNRVYGKLEVHHFNEEQPFQWLEIRTSGGESTIYIDITSSEPHIQVSSRNKTELHCEKVPLFRTDDSTTPKPCKLI